MTSTESGKRKKAIDKEMKSLEDNHTFTLTKLPEGRKRVGGIETYVYKKNFDYEDNQGIIALVRNPVCRQRCKHAGIKYHFIRSTIREDKMSLVY